MGDGNPGEQGAGEGGKREAGTEIKKAFFFFLFVYYCLSSSLKSEPSKVN